MQSQKPTRRSFLTYMSYVRLAQVIRSHCSRCKVPRSDTPLTRAELPGICLQSQQSLEENCESLVRVRVSHCTRIMFNALEIPWQLVPFSALAGSVSCSSACHLVHGIVSCIGLCSFDVAHPTRIYDSLVKILLCRSSGRFSS